MQVAQIIQRVSAVLPWEGESIIAKKGTSSSLLFCSFLSSLLLSIFGCSFFLATQPHPLPLRLWHLLSLLVNQLNLPEQQKTIQVSSCALSRVKCAHRWEWGVQDRDSTSPLSNTDKLFYVLIKSQEMVPFVTLGFFQRSFILKDAGSKPK